jgi:AAA domain
MRAPTFVPATKTASKARVALVGPSGAGKTFSALAIAKGLGPRIALIDTERGTARKYAGDPFEFDVLELASFSPRAYVDAIAAAARAAYDVLIIDSLSHAWSGRDGALEQLGRRTGTSGNTFAAWREITPMHNALVDAMLDSPLHLIATMRVKTAYAITPDENGRMVPKVIGLAPVQRAGIEHEFDVVAELDQQHVMRITKTRYRGLDGAVLTKPDRQVGEALLRWLSGTGSTALLEPETSSAAAAATGDAAAVTTVGLKVILENARDAGQLRGKQIITDFCRTRGYVSWQDFVDRGRVDAPALIRELQLASSSWRKPA